MKRKIALLLAVVMVLSLVPMMAFAASDNSVSRVAQVTKDTVLSGTSVPKLRIEEKRVDEFEEEYFRLTLDGAEWTKDSIKDFTVGTDFVYVNYLSSKTVAVTVYGDKAAGANLDADGKVRFDIPLFSKIKENGEATVTVESRGSAVTGGTYVFANAAKGSTITTVDGTKTFSTSTNLKNIQIDETKAGGFKGAKTVRLLLPRDFEWTNTKAEIEGMIKFAGDYKGLATATVDVDVDEITIDLVLPTTEIRGSIFLDGLGIKATRDADFGEVVLKVRGDAEADDIVVAKYADYGVTVEAEEPTEVFAGRFSDKYGYQNETHEMEKIVIKETLEDSWLVNRKTEIEFPSWVRVIDYKTNKVADHYINGLEVSIDENIVEITATDVTDGEKAELEITFYVSVEADATGDITAVVSGRSLAEEYEVVVGKALAPVELETTVENVRVGLQSQAIGNIKLVETKAGAFMKDTVEVVLDDGFRWKEVPEIEVTEGDLRIDLDSAKIQNDRRTLVFDVTGVSDKASTVEITDAKVDLWRTLPEGEFTVSVGGKALVKNYEELFSNSALEGKVGSEDVQLEDLVFRTEFVAEAVIAKVITPAPGETSKEGISLTIGVVPADGDVAPYLANNRTYAPVSAVAQALGVAKSNIIWNAEARTVTILGDKTVQMTIGSTTLVVNGTTVVMDAAPEITNNRTFLPIAWIAKALDVQYSWDAATQTVTFN